MCCVLPAWADSYAGHMQITTLRAIGTNNIYVGLALPPSDTCTNFGEHLVFDYTTDNGKAIFSALLAAQAADKDFDIWYSASTAPGSDQSTGCTGAAVSVLHQVRIRT